MARGLLSVYLFVLLAKLATIQVVCTQITLGDVRTVTVSITNFTPITNVADGTSTKQKVEYTTSEVKETTTTDGKQTTTAEIEQSTTVEVKQTVRAKVEQNITTDIEEDATTTVKPTPALIDTGSMSKKVYDDFKVSSVYLQFLFLIIGIFANICNIAVFTNKRMRSATSTILTFLSSSELGAAICELIMSSCTAALGRKTYTSKIFWTLFQWVRIYLTVVFQRSSFCFNIIVASERFIAVKFPLKAKQILKRRNPLLFCAVTFVIVLSLHIYNPLKMKVVGIDTRHGIIHMISNSQQYIDNPDTFDVLSLITKILFSYIPLFGCILMNVMMVMALWSHRKERKLMQTSQNSQQQNEKRQRQTTITILVSTFLFVLLSLPVTTSTIAQTTIPEYGQQKKEHYLFRFITLFGGLLYLLSLSMDFFVYMILSRAFRQTFVSLARTIFRCQDEHMAIRNETTGTKLTGLSSDSTNKSGGEIAMSTVCKFDNPGCETSDASLKYEVNSSSKDSRTNEAGNQMGKETNP